METTTANSMGASGRKLFSIDALGADIVAGLSEAAVNPGDAFLSGMQTSPFSASVANALGTATNVINTTTSMANTVANMGNASAGMAAGLVGKGQAIGYAFENMNLQRRTAQILDSISQNIETTFKDELLPYSKDELKRLARETGNAFSSYLVQRTAYWTAETSKKSVSEYLAEFMTPFDKKIEDEENSEKEDRIKKGIQKAQEVSTLINDTVMTTVSTLNNGMDSILQFASAGPEYLEDKVNIYMNSLLVPTKKEIADKTDDIIDWSYKTADEIAKSAGTAAGNKLSQLNRNAAAKQKAKIEKAKITVVSFAKGALDLVKKKAQSLLGL